MLEVILLIAAVAIGITLVMRMDVTPRATDKRSNSATPKKIEGTAAAASPPVSRSPLPSDAVTGETPVVV